MKHYTQSFFIIIAAVVIGLGTTYALAAGPTQAPPGGNTFAPINTGNQGQTKAGIFTVLSSILAHTAIGADSYMVTPHYCIGTPGDPAVGSPTDPANPHCISAWPAGTASGTSLSLPAGSDNQTLRYDSSYVTQTTSGWIANSVLKVFDNASSRTVRVGLNTNWSTTPINVFEAGAGDNAGLAPNGETLTGFNQGVIAPHLGGGPKGLRVGPDGSVVITNDLKVGYPAQTVPVQGKVLTALNNDGLVGWAPAAVPANNAYQPCALQLPNLNVAEDSLMVYDKDQNCLRGLSFENSNNTKQTYGLYSANASGIPSPGFNTLVVGNFNQNNITPVNLTIKGNTRTEGGLTIPSGAGASKVLTSDATGNASWQPGLNDNVKVFWSYHNNNGNDLTAQCGVNRKNGNNVSLDNTWMTQGRVISASGYCGGNNRIKFISPSNSTLQNGDFNEPYLNDAAPAAYINTPTDNIWKIGCADTNIKALYVTCIK